MTTNNRNDLIKILKQRRVARSLNCHELAVASGVSASLLSRMERGERSFSARTLRKLAKPLGFEERELLTLAGYLSPQSAPEVESRRLDPYAAVVLSQEPVEIQRAVVTILTVLKGIAKGSGCNISFAEYVHRKYPGVDEDIITMVKDILEHPSGGA